MNLFFPHFIHNLYCRLMAKNKAYGEYWYICILTPEVEGLGVIFDAF
jgi:hypothetical protein